MKRRGAAQTSESGQDELAAETCTAVPSLTSPVRYPLSAIRYPRRRFLRFVGGSLLAIVAAPVLAACTGAIDKQYTVEMYNERNFDKEQGGSNGFNPGKLTIPVGATVTWFNRGTYAHTATDDPSKAQNKTDAALPNGVAPWDSGDLYPGQSWTRTFDVPGKYVYFDRYQESLGMIGTIIVNG